MVEEPRRGVSKPPLGRGTLWFRHWHCAPCSTNRIPTTALAPVIRFFPTEVDGFCDVAFLLDGARWYWR